MSKFEIVKCLKSKVYTDLAIGETVRIGGLVSSFEKDESPYGEYTRFLGDFAMIHKGKVYKSARLILPDIAANLLESALVESIAAGGDGFRALEFALDIGKKADSDPRNARGYVWAVEPLKSNPAQDRAVSVLGVDLSKLAIATDAPAETPALEAPKAEEPAAGEAPKAETPTAEAPAPKPGKKG